VGGGGGGFFGVKCKNNSSLRGRLLEGAVSYNNKCTMRGKLKEHGNVSKITINALLSNNNY
jgi:hypothetical protein